MVSSLHLAPGFDSEDTALQEVRIHSAPPSWRRPIGYVSARAAHNVRKAAVCAFSLRQTEELHFISASFILSLIISGILPRRHFLTHGLDLGRIEMERRIEDFFADRHRG